MAETKKKKSPTRRTKKKITVFNQDVTVEWGDETPSSNMQAPKGPGKRPPTPGMQRRRVGNNNKLGGETFTGEQVEKTIEEFVNSVLATGVTGLRAQYQELKNYVSPTYKIDIFNNNTKKNRYTDVVCLDDTRVKLTVEEAGDSDYIHANWVKLDGHDRVYIATQGPLEETISDFWRMCLEHNVFCIVMLCNTTEEGKARCSQYWPEKQGEFKTYGKVFVNNKKVEVEDRFNVHHIEVLPQGCSDSKIIKLIQFLSWPDRGVPLSGRTVLRLLRFITQQDRLASGSVVIHCSAGIGRTGTIVMIDWVLQRLFRAQSADVPDMFKKLRNQRASAIQTEGQYIFIFLTILDYIRARLPNKFKDQCDKFHDEVKAANLNI